MLYEVITILYYSEPTVVPQSYSEILHQSLNRITAYGTTMAEQSQENSYELKVMKIAVTGSAGFIGAHLVDRLAREGHEVHALVRSMNRITSYNVCYTKLLRICAESFFQFGCR